MEGCGLLEKWLGVKKIVIAIEDNKPDCIARLREATRDDSCVEVRALPCMYPQGGEKVLIYHVTGKVMPEGKLPIDVGSVVMNVTSLGGAGHLLPHRDAAGGKVRDGGRLRHPGAEERDRPHWCLLPGGGGVCGRLLLRAEEDGPGGPMMGVAQYDLDAPVAKGTSAILVFNEKDARPVKPTACIRCGGCVDHCPMRLMPTEIERAYEKKDAEALRELKVGLCIECGCCAFHCPANRPLVQVNKLSKSFLRDYDNQMKAQKEAGKNERPCGKRFAPLP